MRLLILSILQSIFPGFYLGFLQSVMINSVPGFQILSSDSFEIHIFVHPFFGVQVIYRYSLLYEILAFPLLGLYLLAFHFKSLKMTPVTRLPLPWGFPLEESTH